MTTVPIIWANYNPDAPAKGYWDQTLLGDLLDGRLWRVPAGPTYEHRDTFDRLDGQGAVVVIPGPANAGHIGNLIADLARLEWVLLIVTSDEEGRFDWRAITHPRIRRWVQYPRGALSRARWLPIGYAPDTPAILADFGPTAHPRPLVWAFEGQVNTPTRQACVAAMAKVPGGLAYPTEGFAQGSPRSDYLQLLANAALAPAPAGFVHPDSFRLWEALEAGAVPITDSGSSWAARLRGAPWPMLADWRAAPDLAAQALTDPALPARCSSWWQQQKRHLAHQLADDIADLAGLRPAPAKVADMVTVLIPTSPIPSHPDTTVLEETLASVRAQPDLADSEVLILCDGVRPEQDHYRDRYAEYLQRVAWLCEHAWPQTVPVVHEAHQHQARMTRKALEKVRTPLVLFVEHDTPICGPIPWGELAALLDGDADLIRLHHEAQVLDAHRHLMVDDAPQERGGLPVWRTIQWSQRPHLARVDYYRRILARHFTPGERWMIEDRMHSVVQDQGWDRHRLWLYAPPGDMKRSLHLDGRAGDTKWVDR